MAVAPEIGELECQRRAIEVEVETVRERPAGLAERSGDARDRQVRLVVKILRRQMNDRVILDDPARALRVARRK